MDTYVDTYVDIIFDDCKSSHFFDYNDIQKHLA